MVHKKACAGTLTSDTQKALPHRAAPKPLLLPDDGAQLDCNNSAQVIGERILAACWQ